MEHCDMPANTKTAAKSAMKSSTMSAAHKASLAKGREEGRIVRIYLEALESTKPRRGRRRTPQGIEGRLATIESSLIDASPLERVQLIQERMDLEAELADSEEFIDVDALASDFAKVAKGYGSRKGLSYAAWRAVGVPAAVLRQAGISRST